MSRSSEVAIIGMGCRFPGGAATAEAFWNILENGYDATVDVPPSRWSVARFHASDPALPGKTYARRGGFLREPLEYFDAQFFGISPREATPMDPQQRLLLEVTWEACEDAGVVPGRLRGSRTGVFVGGFTLDNQLQHLNANNLESISTHTAVSATLGMLANRVSHTYDLCGPSMTVDTACSSSLVALHLACQSLALGECELAFAGGVSVMFRPAYAIAMSKGGFLAADGRCKAFDARGDGYGRGEGAGVVLLKPLQAALRDGDPIRAVIVSTGVNQDGHTQGITLPNENAQAELFSAVCRRAGVRPEQIQYVEAHGTGTVAGDAAEARAIGRTFGAARAPDAPLLVGSAKSNIGHLEAAAGIAGVIKASLALEKRRIPPSLHYQHPPSGLDLAQLNLRIPVATTAWPRHEGRALAAVNGFGFGGTNAHALLASGPGRELAPPQAVQRPLVFPVSARSGVSLQGQLKNLYQWVAASPELSVSDLGYTLARRRSHHAHRAALVARSAAELSEQLRQFFMTSTPAPHHSAERLEGRRPARLAFVYTGMGAQSWGMGTELLARDPLAQSVLERCDAIWSALSGWSLRELFTARTGKPMRDPRHAQPANFVLQVLLTELCRSHGVAPAGVVGHSTGEIAAAWCTGSLTLEDALRLTWHRSRLQQRCVGLGGMLAVATSLEELGQWLAEHEGVFDVAALTGPRSVTLAGPVAALERLAERLRTHGIWARLLEVDVPYHSRHMACLQGEFLAALQDLSLAEPSLPTYSSVTGAVVRAGERDAAYFFENLRGTVRFGDALAQMARDGFDTFLELGPHPVLAAAIKEGLGAQRRLGEAVPTLRRGVEETRCLAEHVARLYTLGVDLDWETAYPAGNLLSLPPYAWDRQLLWSETALSRAERFGGNDHPLLARRVGEAVPCWECDLSISAHPYLAEHRFDGEAIFPAAGFIELALAAARPGHLGTLVLEDVRFERPLAVLETPLLRLHRESNGLFSIHARSRTPDSEFQQHVWGRASSAPGPSSAAPLRRQPGLGEGARVLDVAAFLARAEQLGLQYGPSFRSLRSGHIHAGVALTRLEISAGDAEPVNGYWVHPALLDGALQTCLASYMDEDPQLGAALLPVAVRRVRLYRQAGPALWCECRRARASAPEAERGANLVDVTLFDDAGVVVLELEGLETRAVPARRASRARQVEIYAQRWLQQPARAPEPREPCWQLVFCDGGGIGAALCAEALPLRIHSVRVLPGPAFRRVDAMHFELPRGSRAALERLSSELSDVVFADVVYLWSLDQPDSLAQRRTEDATGVTDLIDLLQLCQVLERPGPAQHAALTIATAGCQHAEAGDVMLAAPAQHALWSAARALAIECPQRTIRVLDLASRLPFTAARSLLAELCLRSPEPEVAYRGEQRWVGRVVPLGAERYPSSSSLPGQAYALAPLERGGQRSLAFVEVPRRSPSGTLVEVCSVAHVLGEPSRPSLTGEAKPLGRSICSGRVSAVGPQVRRVAVGERVVVTVPIADLASHVLVSEQQVLPVPPDFPETHAGTLLDWLDACRALFTLGGLEAGQRVLIHRAECGLGHAAVQLASWAGARVLATAATAEAREALRRQGVEQVSDCQSLDFQRDALAWTDGRGVDVVLDTLQGDLRTGSLACLAPGGTFVDALAGARREVLPLGPGASELRYVRCEREVWLADASEVARAVQVFATRYRAGAARPLPLRVFAASSLQEALQELQRARPGAPLVLDLQQGPVTLASRLQQPLVRPDATYLVTGGFGGVGLESLSWLARRGARHLAVLSRSGPRSAAAQARLHELRAAGVQIEQREVDVGDARALQAALRSLRAGLPPVRGVLHGAAVLADADLLDLRDSDVERAMSAKAGGALHLHQQLAGAELDFFVCHGSLSAAVGNARQYGYAGANGFLHGLTEWRRAQGQPATCIDWGPIAGTGMLAHDSTAAWLARLGLAPLAIEHVFETLDEALQKGWGTLAAADIDWSTWLGQLPPRLTARFSLLQASHEPGGLSPARALRGQLLALEPQERSALILRRTSEVAARVLAMQQSRIDASIRLQDLGIDSLMAQEMSHALYECTGVRLRTLYMARGPSLAEVTDLLVDGILSSEAAA